ncbi:hypothetical protein JVU11DRAFT_4450 [Chiua virens]|nr:hypothetical protein JVU11DRAFT_4450 [Chiua virens]
MKFDDDAPPPYSTPRPPPSGYRIPLKGGDTFPGLVDSKGPVCQDSDNTSPIFLGSAIFDNSVHPCKIGPCLVPHCRVPYGGSEVEHHGRFDLLPFDPDTMVWVPTSLGRVPAHRRPVQAGHEENGAYLYHAIATVRDTRVPGKTGEHLVSISSVRWFATNDSLS